jgi:hypothetical protein
VVSEIWVFLLLEMTPAMSEDGKTVHAARMGVPDVSIETLTAVGCVMLRNWGNVLLVMDFGRELLSFVGEAVEDPTAQARQGKAE